MVVELNLTKITSKWEELSVSGQEVIEYYGNPSYY